MPRHRTARRSATAPPARHSTLLEWPTPRKAPAARRGNRPRSQRSPRRHPSAPPPAISGLCAPPRGPPSSEAFAARSCRSRPEPQGDRSEPPDRADVERPGLCGGIMKSRTSSTAMAIIFGFGLHPAVCADEKAEQPSAPSAPQAQGSPPAAPSQPPVKVSAPPTAEEVEALRREIEELRRQIQTLRDQLRAGLASGQGMALGAAPGETASAIPSPPPAPGLPAAPPAAASQTSNYFNPSISVIGNYLGVGGSNGTENLPSSSLRESEVSFQAIVDPYARADFFLSFGEEGVDVEEGFLTFTSLPGGLLTKVGKMRAAFGKVNTLHNHVLPWTDRPLVTRNLVGGEDGIDDAGISVARLIPNRWIFLEATGQVFRGDAGPDENPLFRTSRRAQASYVGHLRGYQDLSESTNIDLGASVSRGYDATGLPQDIDDMTTRLVGVDATLRWRPLQRSIYHSFVARSEVVWSRREQPNGVQKANGFYVSG